MQWVKGFECTNLAIKTDVPHQIWEASTASTDQLPIWLVRFFHNKLRYFSVNYTQCYFHFLSPKFLLSQLGIIRILLLTLLLTFVWKKFPKSHKVLILGIAIYPLIMVFELYR